MAAFHGDRSGIRSTMVLELPVLGVAVDTGGEFGDMRRERLYGQALLPEGAEDG